MSLPSRPHSKYEALAFVAAGGMATVHVGARGGQESSGFVALKSPHPHLVGDPSFRRMFLTEGRLGSRLAHPNVVRVLEIEEREDALTLVMPYVEGGSLSERSVASGAVPPLSLHAVLRIILDAIAGVEALHALEDEGGSTPSRRPPRRLPAQHPRRPRWDRPPHGPRHREARAHPRRYGERRAARQVRVHVAGARSERNTRRPERRVRTGGDGRKRSPGSTCSARTPTSRRSSGSSR